MRTRNANGVYVAEYSKEAVARGITLLNAGAGWHEAARAAGMGIDNLRKRGEAEGYVLRKGRPSFVTEMRLNLPTDTHDLAYLAALLDGEGSVTIAKNPRNTVRVAITNVDVPLMKWLESIGGGVSARRKIVKRQQCYVWQLYGRLDIKAFLDAVVPYMRIKKQKAQDAIALLKSWVDDLEKARSVAA
jgi:hypothetical protein